MSPSRQLPRRRVLAATELHVGPRTLGAPLTYWEPGGQDIANITRHDERALAMVADVVMRDVAGAWTVFDKDGDLFELRRYEAADDLSFDVVEPGGTPLATFYVDAGLIHDQVIVRDGTSAPVGEIVTDEGVHELRELHGSALAESRRVFERPGGDGIEQVWDVIIHPEGDRLFDRRVLVAAPLVCLLTAHSKREWDPDSAVGVALLVAFPPAGFLVLAVERTLDGLYWLRRKLN
ncbi:MAG: hypothetical protein M3159_04790 [Actinomycetota bacterium]|nr:hypothetical protein [Actinomycetota bacterium]